MIIDGTSYKDQGEYISEVVNLIAGRRSKVQSVPAKLEVRGKNKKIVCWNNSNSQLGLSTKNRNYILLLSKHYCFKQWVIMKKLKKRPKNEYSLVAKQYIIFSVFYFHFILLLFLK